MSLIKRHRDEQEQEVVKTMEKNMEMKWFIVNTAPSFAALNTQHIPLSDIPQGVGQSQRVSDRVRLKNMSYTMQIGDSTATATTRVMRVIIYQWYPITSTTLLWTDVLDGNSWSAQLNMGTRQQYRILADETRFILTTTSKNYHLVQGTINIPEKSRDIQFSPAGGTAGCNKLFCSVQVGSVAASHVFSIRTSLRYYDM